MVEYTNVYVASECRIGEMLKTTYVCKFFIQKLYVIFKDLNCSLIHILFSVVQHNNPQKCALKNETVWLK